MIDRHRLEAAGVDYERMKIYYYVGTSKELKGAKMLRLEDFKYPALNPQ